jgi:hypothetical protein
MRNKTGEKLADVLFKEPPEKWIDAIVYLLREIRKYQTKQPIDDRFRAQRIRKALQGEAQRERDNALPTMSGRKKGNPMYK